MPLFFANVGDMHYAGMKDCTKSDFLKGYHEVFKSSSQRDFLQGVPVVYTLDDHDSGSNNANGND